MERGNYRIYFPVATCVVLSLGLMVVPGLVRYFSVDTGSAGLTRQRGRSVVRCFEMHYELEA